MSQMIENMVKSVLRKTIKNQYPHLKLPGSVYARVTKVRPMGDHYEYNLKILDENKVIDDKFPEIPKVKSRLNIENGKVVAILLMYGQLNAHIVGEVV